MKTLIIYDNEGYIIQQISGDYRVPVGVPFLEVVIPTGKIIKGVNIETKEVILTNIPPTETEILKNRIQEQELAILELASMIGGSK
ncbi:hypothetical protein [Clostridium algidicarnis]|uniref:hypothetical protein n=1 Tax=Clostridium algidicarnis TaxID=37659 RepID=UPI001C0D97FF|nr:hypothetical protein [Clostridium algidicarnis]MBU3193453.1 hypothetical protein [Clostridium algidicarnis]MBU3203142.1 hypothetical protein [Clostridium algidicarnis]MBU3211296.1 hypothetical protein [Clostridium algidicarnis]MBU3222196.1 hypothetical protein [Clostridium algidicarnis]